MDSVLLRKAARKVRELYPEAKPVCALVLGSGWGVVVDAFEPMATLSYADIPVMGPTQVEGHAGALILARFEDRELLVFQGRRHWYEGVGWEPIAVPVRIAQKFGTPNILLTNAAGGIREGMSAGDLMILDDHINLMGVNPLVGEHDLAFGHRFPDQTSVYEKPLRDLLDDAAAHAGIPVSHGVYVAASGPTYETPAEVRAYRILGGDAVGMSTVPEAMLANAAGMSVAAVSCITNLASGMSASPLCHQEVIEATNHAKPHMRDLLLEFLRRLPPR